MLEVLEKAQKPDTTGIFPLTLLKSKTLEPFVKNVRTPIYQ